MTGNAGSKMIFEILGHGGEDGIVHHVVERFPVHVGRAYDNDIILHDPHVSARHLRIDNHDGVWMVHDLNSENGIWQSDRTRLREATPVASGMRLRVGRTDIRLLAPDHPVPQTLKLQRLHPALALATRPVAAWSLFLTACLLGGFLAHLSSWTKGWAEAASAIAVVGFCILVWSGLWALTARLFKRKSRFRSHLALTSGFCALWFLGAEVAAYANFLMLSDGIGWTIAFCVLFGVLLSSHLSLSTQMMPHRAKRVSAIMILLVAGGVFAVGLAAESEEFPSGKERYATLKPYLTSLTQAETLDRFMQDNVELFSSDALRMKNDSRNAEDGNDDTGGTAETPAPPDKVPTPGGTLPPQP